MTKRVLMVAFHFPPVAGSSGVQRTLRFARYLPEFGWQPLVLSAHPRAYERRSDDQMGDIPEGLEVIRAPAWDTARHLTLAGRYPGILARPDRWASWWPGAVVMGLSAIRQYRPDVLWSTYPIATAHRIGATLARRTGLPWVADFRDPMAQDGYPEDPAVWRSFSRIESRTVRRARASVFTTPGAFAAYRERYPEFASRFHLVENGYDEETFSGIDASAEPLNPQHLTLLHSGVVYPSERDPTQLFEALGHLREQEPGILSGLRIRFRAAVHETLLRDLARRHHVESVVELLPPVGYREALTEMLRADGLLILQAANCNAQVPAKLYEYLRAHRPVITLTDPEGDTAKVAHACGIQAVAPLDDALAIADLLVRFIQQPTLGTVPTEAAIRSASRRERTQQLAQILDRAHAQAG